jgi:hypothetical protein
MMYAVEIGSDSMIYIKFYDDRFRNISNIFANLRSCNVGITNRREL